MSPAPADPFPIRVDAHYHRFSRILMRVYLALFVAILFTVLALGPIDTPTKALLLAVEAALLGLTIGYEQGTRRRQFIRVRGRGPRISQSAKWVSGELIYSSYDLLDHAFNLQPAFVSGVLSRAISTAPFSSLSPSNISEDAKEGRWIFQTEDSYGRPTFLDESGLVAMGAYCEDLFKKEPLSPILKALTESRSQNRMSGNSFSQVSRLPNQSFNSDAATTGDFLPPTP